MNQAEANQLLDKVKDGADYSYEQIRAALFATGDIYAGVRGARVDSPISRQDEPSGKCHVAALVGGNQSQYRQDSWAGWSRYLNCRDVQATQ